MTHPTAVELLLERVSELDALDLDGSGSPVDCTVNEKLSHVVDVMSRYTNTYPSTVRDGLTVSPAAADSAASASWIVDNLAHLEPSLTVGPVARGRQQWIGLGRSRDVNGEALALEPSRTRFRPFLHNSDPKIFKPFDCGFHTATQPVAGGANMWRLYLDPYEGSDLFPTPWRTWDLRVGDSAQILEVASAQDWSELIDRYPTVSATGQVYLNWAEAAIDFDAIHVSLRAVVATQSLQIETRRGPAATPFWDVEQTVWLTWPTFLSVDMPADNDELPTR